MIQFNKIAFLLSDVFLAVLFYIALFVHDAFIRPFIGDVLVVIWLFLVLKAFLSVNSYHLAHCVLGVAISLEIAQFFNLVELLGLQGYQFARIIIGTTFDWLDILAYSIGWTTLLIVIAVVRSVNTSVNKEREEFNADIENTFSGRHELSVKDFYSSYFLDAGVDFEVVKKVREILEEKLGADLSRLSAEDDFATNLSFIWDYDSMANVDIIIELEREFKLNIEAHEAENTRTIKDLIMLIHQKTKAG